jgi:hypothetical protein
LNQIIFNNTKVTPTKVIIVNQKKNTIYTKPNSTISTILQLSNDNIKLQSKISFLIQDDKIAGISLGLNTKSSNITWENASNEENSTIFSDFVPFDKDIKYLSHQLLQNDDLVQESNFNNTNINFEQLLTTIKEQTQINNNDIIMLDINKDVLVCQECDLFMGSVYYEDASIVEACFEAI